MIVQREAPGHLGRLSRTLEVNMGTYALHTSPKDCTCLSFKCFRLRTHAHHVLICAFCGLCYKQELSRPPACFEDDLTFSFCSLVKFSSKTSS